MSRISTFVLSASLITMAGACGGGSGGRTVTDTLGKVFSVSCSKSRFCALTPQDSTLKPLSCDSNKPATDTFVLVWGTHILTAHAVAAPSSKVTSLNAAEPAHPIACKSDADCLPDLLSERYDCVGGLCKLTTDMLTVDVSALCQADIPWPTSCPYQTNPLFASRMAEVASLCGSTTVCSKVPADCSSNP
jgi:hypothetical protein